jgi:hypothetical protein
MPGGLLGPIEPLSDADRAALDRFVADRHRIGVPRRIPARKAPLTPAQLRLYARMIEAYLSVAADELPPTLREILVQTVGELRRLHGAAPS